MPIALFIGTIISFAWMALHIGFMHIRPAENRFRSITLGYLLSLPFIFLAYWVMPVPEEVRAASAGQSVLMGLILSYILHLLLYFLYAECFYHVERAVSLRFLIEIMQQPGATATLDYIMRHYNVREMITTRLRVLESQNFITCAGNRWRLKPKGMFFAKAMQFSCWLFQSKGQSDRL